MSGEMPTYCRPGNTSQQNAPIAVSRKRVSVNEQPISLLFADHVLHVRRNAHLLASMEHPSSKCPPIAVSRKRVGVKNTPISLLFADHVLHIRRNAHLLASRKHPPENAHTLASREHPPGYSSQFKNNHLTEMGSGSEAGSYSRPVGFRITQL